MLVGITLARLVGVAARVSGVSLGNVRMMGGLFGCAGFVVSSRFAMMTRGLLVMYSRQGMILGFLVGHSIFSCHALRSPPRSYATRRRSRPR
jgi:hypothetical protein